jgi:hypothetical protein
MNDFLIATGWLYTKIYQNDLFFFDLWSFVHFWNGFMLFFLIGSTRTKNPFKTILVILFIYEIIEILFIYFALGIFSPETFKDQFTDIVVGLSGSLTGYYLLNSFSLCDLKKAKQLKIIIMIFSSLTYGFLWVGFYGYHYNIDFFNSPGINWYAWLLWSLNSIILIYSSKNIPVRNRIARFLSVWILWLIGLFAAEAAGYYWLGLHEISDPNATPLIFGIIHGSVVMHLFYVFAPFPVIGLYGFLSRIILRPFYHEKKFSLTFSISIYHLIQMFRKRSLTNK